MKPQAVAMMIESVAQETGSAWPPALAARIGGRAKRRLGDAFGLSQFGVNEVTLAPGARSALRHWHTREDEFVLILEGVATLETEAGTQTLTPGMCAGFAAGVVDAHALVNRSTERVRYLEIGTRDGGDCAFYPDDDVMLVPTPEGVRAHHKDGRPYES